MVKLEFQGDLLGHQHPIYALCTSQKDHIIFSGGGEGAVVEWSLKTMQHVKVMYKTNASIYCLHCPEHLPLLVSGDREGKISIFNFDEQKLVFQQQLTKLGIFGMLSIENKLFFISEDGFMRVLNLENFEVISEVRISDLPLRCITYNSEDQMLYLSGKDLRIHHFSILQNKVLRSEEQHTLSVFTLAYDAENKQLLSGARDAQIKVWRMNETLNIPAHLYAVNKIEIIPGASVFASASMDKSIKLWDATSLNLLSIADAAKNHGHHKSANTLCYTMFQNTLVSAGDDRMIKVWKLAQR